MIHSTKVVFLGLVFACAMITGNSRAGKIFCCSRDFLKRSRSSCKGALSVQC